MIQKFIVIDDDKTNNMLCTYIIEDVVPDATIVEFTDAEEALGYIKSTYANTSSSIADTILFLDINMPIMDGWQFLKAFALFDDHIKSNIEIHMLSSSIDQRDMDYVANNKHISSFLGKPLTEETVKKLADR
jgi:CheY-like chemotaxis protein